MKLKILGIICCGLLLSHGHAQIISIKEGKKLVNLDYSIVDINSTLEISIDKAKLLAAVGRNTNANTRLVEQLDRLNFILENQIDILNILESKIKSADQSKAIETLGEYSELMDEFYTRVNKDIEIRARVNELFDEYRRTRAMLDKTVYPNPQTYVLKNLGAGQNEILNTLNNSDEIKQVRVKLIALLNTKDESGRRVHIENFDQYATGEFYELQRWVTTFSEEDIKKFEQSQMLADQLNKLVNSNSKGLENFIKSNLSSPDCFSNLLASYESTFSNKETIFANDAETIGKFLITSQNELLKIYKLLTAIQEFKPTADGKNILSEFNDVQKQFIDAATMLPDQIALLVKGLPESLSTAQAIKDLTDQTIKCLVLLEGDKRKVSSIFNIASNLLSPFKKTANEVNEIGDQVLPFTMNDLPERGTIELKTTGKRQNGDEIVIKLLTLTRRDSIERTPGTYVERVCLKMQQINAYLVPLVSVIAAAPYNATGNVKVDKKFQFAPSGSFVLKFGSRKYNAWNFISPGIGFNMATPDFDLDSTPDVAIGGVVTLLQDIVSIGLSYNTKTDNPMWFFGLSLPFGGLGFPINNNVLKKE